MVVNGDEYVPPDGWTQVDIPAFSEAPFTVWVNHFKSGSPRLKAFVDDPRAFLLGQEMGEEYGGIAGERLEGVGESTRVFSWITNHHNTLRRMVLYATAIVSTEEDSCALTMYKHGPGGD